MKSKKAARGEAHVETDASEAWHVETLGELEKL
jgi:hypothetical protein